MSNQGHICYHLFNTSESKLWADSVKFMDSVVREMFLDLCNSKKCVFLSNVMVSLKLF